MIRIGAHPPGELLGDEIFPAFGLSVRDTAARIGVNRQAMHLVVAEAAVLSPERAVKLAKPTGSGAALLIRMQLAHDL